jgi:nucleoside phosphorylase
MPDTPRTIHSELPIDFAILTPIEVERRAVCAAFNLTDADKIRKGTHFYWRGRLELTDGSSYEIVVAQPTDASNIHMALLTSETIEKWGPEALLLVGIAGSAHNDVGLGDVVIGRDVYYDGRGKETSEGTRPEPVMRSCDTMLFDAAIKCPVWNAEINVSRPDGSAMVPAIHHGIIASVERVIADEGVRDRIASAHRKILAIETEAYGFIQAAYDSIYRPKALVIRSISDAAGADKDDDWHPYAAAVAAGFVKHFLQSEPLPPRNKQTKQVQEKMDSLFVHARQQASAEPNISTIRASTASSQALDSSAIDSSSELERVVSLLSDEKAARIDEIKERFNEGEVRDAYEMIRQMQDDPSWHLLSGPVRAKAWRAMAAFALDSDSDLEKAKDFTRRATDIDPGGDDLTIRAWIVFCERRFEAALEMVQNPRNTKIFNVKMNFFVMLGRFTEVLTCIEQPPNGVTLDYETKRIKSVALIALGDLGRAEYELQEVIRKLPQRENVQTLSAVLDYYAGLSPAALPAQIVTWPEPVGWPLVRKDDESKGRFRSAEKKFQRLYEVSQRDEEHKKILQIWQLASLANDPGRRDEAFKLCTETLKEDPGNHRALIWAIARDFDVDLPTSLSSLEQHIDEASNKNSPVLVEKMSVLVAAYLRLGKSNEALELLDKRRGEFLACGAEDRVCAWRSRALVSVGKYGKSMAEAVRVKDVSMRRESIAFVMQVIATKSGFSQPYLEYLEQCYEETKDGEYLLLLFAAKGGVDG